MEKIEKRWKVSRIIEVNVEAIPEWARCLGFGLYGRQGWTAFDQRNNGAVVATGAWGDELFLLTDGSFACTEYPQGYPAP